MENISCCYSCMHKLDDVTVIKCPFCGEAVYPKTPSHHLRPGTVLAGEYLVGRALGQGGFGITYIGRDLDLDRVVAIKEFYPVGCSSRNSEVTAKVTITQDEDGGYDSMKKRFLDEARVLAKFSGVGGVVNVMRYFAENNTAYFVMEYLRGTDLRRRVMNGGPMRGGELLPLLRPVMQALGKIHAEGVIHRDISPDNLMLLSDGTLKLLDFGAARQMEGNRSLSVELKHGYAPVEQYTGGGQGPWTDVYALCATIYYCLTGVKPPQSVQRAMDEVDELKTPSELGAVLEPWQEAAILRGLAVQKAGRFQSMRELEEALFPADADPTPLIDISTHPDREPARPDGEKKEEVTKKKRGPLIAVLAAVLAIAALILVMTLPGILRGGRAKVPGADAESAALEGETASVSADGPKSPAADVSADEGGGDDDELLALAREAEETCGSYSTISNKQVALEIPGADERLAESLRMELTNAGDGIVYIIPRPESGNGVLDTLTAGAKVTVIAERGDFYFFVADDGRMGWNSKAFFKAASESEAPAADAESEAAETGPAPGPRDLEGFGYIKAPQASSWLSERQTRYVCARGGVAAMLFPEALASPRTETKLADILDGTELTLLAFENNHYLVKTADGRVGWMGMSQIGEENLLATVPQLSGSFWILSKGAGDANTYACRFDSSDRITGCRLSDGKKVSWSCRLSARRLTLDGANYVWDGEQFAYGTQAFLRPDPDQSFENFA